MSGLAPTHDMFGDKITIMLKNYFKDKVYNIIDNNMFGRTLNNILYNVKCSFMKKLKKIF